VVSTPQIIITAPTRSCREGITHKKRYSLIIVNTIARLNRRTAPMVEILAAASYHNRNASAVGKTHKNTKRRRSLPSKVGLAIRSRGLNTNAVSKNIFNRLDNLVWVSVCCVNSLLLPTINIAKNAPAAISNMFPQNVSLARRFVSPDHSTIVITPPKVIMTAIISRSVIVSLVNKKRNKRAKIGAVFSNNIALEALVYSSQI